MSFERRFVVASRGLALTGIVALMITGAVGPVYLLLALASVVWTAVLGWQGRGQGIDNAIANLTIVVSIGLIFPPVVFRGVPPIQAIAEFLLVLTTLRSLAASSGRDWLQIYALSFFELVAASALTIEPAFAVLFGLYLLLAPWALVLLFLRGAVAEAGRERQLREEPFVDPSLFRSLATVTVILFVSTVLIFVFFPRVGAGFFQSPLATGGELTGFSDEIGLGDVTALKENPVIAMRVVVDRPERVLRERRYWRGAALDSFDGRQWTRARQELHPLTRAAPGVYLTAEHADRRALVRQEIILEPMEHPTIFFLGSPREVRGRFTAMMADSLGNLRSITSPGARIRYQVVSSLAPRTDPPPPQTSIVPPVDDRVLALARDLVADLPGDAARAGRLLSFFHEEFEYSTSPGDPGEEDPLYRFLFRTRSGHCEYFASSLAVMLRAVGIPSLVVNGYLGGEWNPYGEYLAIRQSDAHSWVEAWIDGAWRILDPTPPAAPVPGSRFAGWQAMVDAYRMRWYRYVINYTFRDQIDIAFSIRDSTGWAWRGIRGEFWKKGWDSIRGTGTPVGIGAARWIVPIVLVGLVLLWFRRRRGERSVSGRHWATLRYLALLRHLERRGHHKQPQETPDEFLARISPVLDGERGSVARFTDLYQELRFSGRATTPAEQREVESLLEALAGRR